MRWLAAYQTLIDATEARIEYGLFDLGATPEELAASFASSTCRWLVVSYTSDWLFPPFQSQQIVDALIASEKAVSYCNIESSCGHDAFLLEVETMTRLISDFLDRVVAHHGIRLQSS